MTVEIPSDIGREMDQAFAHVEHALRQAGGKGGEQVYKVNGYVTALESEPTAHFVRNLRKYCPKHEPLLTVVGVKSLAFDMHVEIEVSAHLGS
jgi:enamine deaminase RidA (YjgF/YER057c/UK114 family)